MQTAKRPAPSAEGKPGARVVFSHVVDTGTYTARDRLPQPQPGRRIAILTAAARAILDSPADCQTDLFLWAKALLRPNAGASGHG